MEQILKTANELGLMIKKTDECCAFEEAARLVEADDEASLILKKYNELAETIRLKQESGLTVEQYETAQFRDLTSSVSSNSILRRYLEARNRYMDMLVAVYNEIDIKGED